MFRKLWSGHLGLHKEDTNRVHPTQKPVSLIEWFFEQWGKDTVNVIDLYLGSGSTLIGCEKTGRRCYGMEIDQHYVSVIIERWQDFTGQEARLESTGETYNSLKSKVSVT